MKKNRMLGVALSFISVTASAHPGHGLSSLSAGLMHPLTGLDHLLVMLAVGVWAAKLGEQARWQMPLTFIVLMTVGATLGLAGMPMLGVETAIAASVVAMGVLLMLVTPIQTHLRLVIIGVFALVHGMAHGVELTQHSPWAAMTGMLLATALLHGAGIGLAGSLKQSLAVPQSLMARCLHNTFAAGLVLVGASLLLA